MVHVEPEGAARTAIWRFSGGIDTGHPMIHRSEDLEVKKAEGIGVAGCSVKGSRAKIRGESGDRPAFRGRLLTVFRNQFAECFDLLDGVVLHGVMVGFCAFSSGCWRTG